MNSCVVEVEYEYVVLKINGYDISNLTWYEAVQKFLQAKETLVVELCRQKHSAFNLECKQDANTKLPDVDKASSNVLHSNKCKKQISNLTEKPKDAIISASTTTNSASQQVNTSPSTTLAASGEITTKNPVILTLRTLNHEESSGCSTVYAASKETQTQASVDQDDVLKDHDLVQTLTDHFIEREHHLFEQCLEPEIDIEEVTLIKAANNATSDQIGLVVCSSGFQSSSIGTNKDHILYNDLDQCEDVFISHIQPESVAHRDGRLRQGDQILRINGMDVKDQEEVETQIAESNSAVTLLVSRIVYPEDDDEEDINFEYDNTFLPDDYTNVVDKLDKVLLSHVQSLEEISNETGVHSSKSSHSTSEQNLSDFNVNTSSLPKKKFEECKNSTSKIKLCPEASLDQRKTLNQSLNQNHIHRQYQYDENEHIYETIPEDSESEPLYCSPYQSSSGKNSIESGASSKVTTPAQALETTMQQQTQRVAQWLGLKPQYPRTLHTLIGRPPPLKFAQQPTCSRVFTLRSTLTNTSHSSSSGVPYSGYGPNNIATRNVALGEEVDNSSSAYNTGDSNNSASPHQNTGNVNDDISAMHKLESTLIDGPREAFDTTAVSSMLLLPFGKSGRIGLCSSNLETAYVTESQSKAKYENIQLNGDLKLLRVKHPEESFSPCPQFNAPNLSSYHFVSSQEVKNQFHSSTSSKQNATLLNCENSDEIPMVWKVKRRPDGTRYIVKRPVRNRPQVTIRKNVRCNEIATTEEDTVSEVKIGRYWTKEERKRHIERAREKRNHQTNQHQQ
ncbi:slo-interacting protein 1 isoform X2 [Drosophila ficusphila]|uniref:slo-interacting protein 1 isoform X2 n=1 Tax=Drosophila ficusphila TaxID=30025 RepID=UPI0007E83168|nr:slo-interacting protein 1 isoform X2 [Drosophila ficusphila]